MPATAKDVARVAQVALPTAYEALRGDGRLSSSTRQRVLDAATQLGYRPASAARAIRTQRNQRIGVLVKHHPVVMETLLGVNSVLQDRGKQLSIFPFDEDNAEQIVQQAFAERAFDGVMAVDLVSPELEAKCAEEPHCVWVNTNRWSDRDCIRRNEHQAGQLVGRALAETGWKRWRFITRRPRQADRPHFSTAQRLAGLQAAAERYGADLIETLCIEPGRTHWRQLDQTLGPIEPGTALVFNDSYRVRTMQNVLINRGLTHGQDLAIVCCDDTQEFAVTWPELSRARFDRFQLGQAAAQMLIDRIDEQQPQPSQELEADWEPGETLVSRRQ
ncbi:MAG: LacI family DNA-binding transcriptional regulator [Planctomycetota bacterium]